MRPFWRLTDRDLVERTERFHTRWRRPFAVFLLVLVAVQLAVGAWFVYLTFWKYDPLMFDEAPQTAYHIGLMLGYFLAKWAFFVLATIIIALSILFGGRKDRLLIAYFHRLEELHQSMADGQRGTAAEPFVRQEPHSGSPST